MKTNRTVNVGPARLLSQADPDALTVENGRFDRDALVALRFALAPNPKKSDAKAVLVEFPNGRLTFDDLVELAKLAGTAPERAEAKLRACAGDPELRLREFALFADDVASREAAFVRGTTLGVGGDLLTALRVWGGYGNRITLDDAQGKTRVIDTREVSLLTTPRGSPLTVNPASVNFPPIQVASPRPAEPSSVSSPAPSPASPLQRLRARLERVANNVLTAQGELKDFFWATPIGSGSVAEALSSRGALELYQEFGRDQVAAELARAMNLPVTDAKVSAILRRLDEALTGTLTQELTDSAVTGLKDTARRLTALASDKAQLARLRAGLTTQAGALGAAARTAQALGMAEVPADLDKLVQAARVSDAALQEALRAQARDLTQKADAFGAAPLAWRAALAARFQERLKRTGYAGEILRKAVDDSTWAKSRDEATAVLSLAGAASVALGLGGGAALGSAAQELLRAASTTPLRSVAAPLAKAAGAQLGTTAALLASLGGLTGCALPWEQDYTPKEPTRVERNQAIWESQEPALRERLKLLTAAIDAVEAEASEDGESLSTAERNAILTALRATFPSGTLFGEVFKGVTAEGLAAGDKSYRAALEAALANAAADLTETSVLLSTAHLLSEVAERPGWGEVPPNPALGFYGLAADLQGVPGKQPGAVDVIIHEGARKFAEGMTIEAILAPLHFYTTTAGINLRASMAQLIALTPAPVSDDPQANPIGVAIDAVWDAQTPEVQAQLSQLGEALRTGDLGLVLSAARDALPQGYQRMLDGMSVDGLATAGPTWQAQLTELLESESVQDTAKAMVVSYFLLDLDVTLTPEEAWQGLIGWATEIAGRAPESIIAHGRAAYAKGGEAELDAYLDALPFYAYDGEAEMREHYKVLITLL